MITYTIGIATTKDNIILIRKTKPAWQAGKFNYVGGKVEGSESAQKCIAREFEEETSIKTTPESWKYLGMMQRENDFVCYVLAQENEEFVNCKTTTEEQVVIWSKIDFIRYFQKYPEDFMSNLLWMYDYSRCRDFDEYKCTFDIIFPENTSHELK